MWPKYLDLDAQSCAGILRKLELEAYSAVVNALRAQGELTKERRKAMHDLSNVLNISIERHKAEIRRAVNDELLNTIAARICGDGKNEQEWAKEGRRIIPLLKRATPITAFTPLADSGSESISSMNRSLPSPLSTKSESKRRTHHALATSKYTTKTPPKDICEMVTKVKDEETDETYCVLRSPPLAVPATPPNVKAYSQYFGGEVVVLPSGKAVRLNQDKFNEINEAIDNLHKNKRKRKMSASASDISPNFSRSFEVIPKNALMAMMPPPLAPPSSKMGILGQHLMTSTPTIRGLTTRGRRGTGSRGGRRPRGPKQQPQQPTQQQQPLNNLAMLAEAVSHQQEIDNALASPVASEPPQMAITPPKVVVVTTPSGTVLRTSNETPPSSSAASTMNLTMTTSSTTPVATKVTQPPPAASTASTIKLKEASSPMKVFPVGAARILPKTATSGTASSAAGSSPIYMVATSVGGQNFMRVTRPASGQTVTLSSGQRVVTVSTSSLRPQQQGVKQGPGAAVSAIKALQPRVVTSSVSGGGPVKVGGPKNSVIVVQRSGVTAKTLITKDGNSPGGQRIIHTKGGIKQPIVIVSKSSSSSSISDVLTSTASTASNQNVIVLDLTSTAAATTTTSTLATTKPLVSGGNNVLSDILQMTGIMNEDDDNNQDNSTTTLQKVPGDSSSWIVLDSNGSKAKKDESAEKMDIFSQAMASAEIDEFSNNIEVKSSEPALVPPKTNSSSANVIFASPHDVMPNRQSSATGGKSKEDNLFSQNNHDDDNNLGNNVIVERVDEQMISESEVVSMDEDDLIA